MIGENDHVDFEDTSLGSVAFLLGMYADPNGKPEGIVKRYYGDLFEADSIYQIDTKAQKPRRRLTLP